MTGDWLKGLREWFFAQKYRFDLGLQFMVFMNFALLIVTASEKLKAVFGLEHISELLVLLLPLGFFGAWGFGWFMDVVVKAQAQAELEAGKRSPLWRKSFQASDETLKEVRNLRREVKRLAKLVENKK